MLFNQLPRVLLALFVFVLFHLAARAQSDPANQAKRQKALKLFSEGKRLEALPLLEELAEKNPNDGEILVELAACLVEHAATLADKDAAGKERFRAYGLLKAAWGLGYNSPLEENLRQILSELPANGAITYSENSAVDQAMSAGEAAFARRDFAEALKDYGRALELDPANYTATLFIANAYDKKNEFAKAGEWYERAIRMNPDAETAYRYYADMLAKQGDMEKARNMLIHAAVAEPYNKIVWREIRAWATINKTAFNIVYLGIPVPRDKGAAGAEQTADVTAAWKKYYSVKAEWKKGGKFEKRFPQEPEYRHSLAEESEALNAAAVVLEKLKEDPKTAELVTGDATAGLLLRLHVAGLIDAYVLFSLGDDGVAQDYKAYRAGNRGKLESYMDVFVMPPTPARQ